MFAAIYSRSSLGKVKQGDTAEQQVAIVKEYAKRYMPDVNFDDRFVYIDDGQSGFKTTFLQRPEMRKLLSDIDNGFISVVFFKGISRFARDAGESIQTAKRLIQKGVRVVSVEENYDSDKNDPTFFQIYAVMAEAESRKISVRISISNKEKSRHGLYMSSITPLGYVRVKELPEPLRSEVQSSGKHPLSLWPDEKESKIVKKIFELYLNGVGRAKIASYLNERGYLSRKGYPFNENSIRRIITNEVYTGSIMYGMRRIEFIDSDDYERKLQRVEKVDKADWAICENAHPALISKDEFETIRRIAMEREKFFKKDTGRRLNNAKHPLVGILKCGKCGTGMICHKRTVTLANGSKQSYRYYVCPTRRTSGLSVCNQKNINADELEEFVYADMIFKIKDYMIKIKRKKSIHKSKEKNIKEEIKRIENKENDLRKQAKRILDNSDVYDDDTFRKLNMDIKNKIDKLQEERLKLEEKTKIGDIVWTKEEIQEKFKRFMDVRVSDHEQLREVFLEAIDTIEIKDDTIIVNTNFPIS